MSSNVDVVAHNANKENYAADEVVLSIHGMHCASCVGRVEKMLGRVPGVQSVAVSLPAERATIRGSELQPDQLAQVVDGLGFEAAVMTGRGGVRVGDEAGSSDHGAHARSDVWRWRVVVGIAVTVPLKLLHWFHGPLGVPMGVSMWVSALLGTACAVVVGWPFFVGAAKSLRSWSATMDTLVALGASAAVLVSWIGMVEWIRTGERAGLYFAEAAALLTLIGLGRLFESRLASITTTDTRALLEAQPGEAVLVPRVESSDGRRVPTTEVKPGDLGLVAAGERVPVDGQLVRGDSAFDETVITGESIPVERGVGDAVVAGAVNTGGAVVVRAAVDGASTTIARIAAMIEGARASKVPMQALADRITAVFVPVVLSIALLAFVGWWLVGDASAAEAGIIAATVLVIACPCALGLATPLAVMAGVGGAARFGVFLRDAAALQRAARVRTVVFDKTGTLTCGTPEVVDAGDEPLRVAAAVCAESAHPIARAIVAAAKKRGLAIDELERSDERAGAGMVGRVAGREVLVLSVNAARRDGFNVDKVIGGLGDGVTISVVIRDGSVLGAIALRDEPRDDARATIDALHRQGLGTHMLSGDRTATARAIGEAVGIRVEDVHAELSPDDKLRAIRTLSGDEERGPVAMVGDGINDAPALAEASSREGVAIAIGSGTAAAIESSDAIAPGDRLESVALLLRVAKETMGAIKVNLVLAFAYNSAAVPVAALGLLGTHGPLVAAVAMGLSNVCVVGNSAWLSVRLRKVA